MDFDDRKNGKAEGVYSVAGLSLLSMSPALASAAKGCACRQLSAPIDFLEIAKAITFHHAGKYLTKKTK